MSELSPPFSCDVFSATHRHYAECGSTNDLARAWALDNDNPAPNGALVTADYQSFGRGRRGRTWDSAAGQNAIMSIVVRPNIPLADSWQIGFAAGVATIDGLGFFGVDARLKWPNDILLDGKKVAGILVETAPMAGGAWAAITGIGVNVNQDKFDMQERLLYPATSLRLASAKSWSAPMIIERIAEALHNRIAELEHEGWEAIRTAWRINMADNLTVTNGCERALLVDIEADGSALVRGIDGTLTRWASVEIGDGL